MSKQQRWETEKIHELCFCCLDEGHKVAKCSCVNRNWNHLRDVNFPQVKSRNKTDMLIGVDYPDFRFSLKTSEGNQVSQ